MFDSIKKLFWEGRIRVEFTTESGRHGVAKANYIGDPSTFGTDDIEDFKRRVYVECGERVKRINKINIC